MSKEVLKDYFACEKQGRYKRNRCFCCRPHQHGRQKAPKFLIKRVLYGKHIGPFCPFHVYSITWLYKPEMKDDPDNPLPSEALHGLSKWKQTLHRKGHKSKHFVYWDGD